MSNQPTEWIHDLPGFQITVTSSDQRVSMKAVNSATGVQYGPQQVFPGINSSVITGCLQNNLNITEVTDNRIRIQTNLANDPIELALQESLPIEKEHNLLKIEVKRLKDEVQILKQPKIFYFKTSIDDWRVHNDFDITVRADISHLNLRNNPHVQVTLCGGSRHWDTTGSNSIYGLTPGTFDIYVKRASGGSLSPEQARQYGWYLSYVIHSLDD